MRERSIMHPSARIPSGQAGGSSLQRRWDLSVRIVLLLAAAACALPVASFARSNGAPPGMAGASLPGEAVCTACHLGPAVDSGEGMISLRIDGLPAEEFSYTPSRQVTVQVSARDANATRFGFQLTVRSAQNGCLGAGFLSAGPSTMLLRRAPSGECVTTPGRLEWLTHTFPADGTSAEFEMAWTGPTDDVGPVQFAFAVVAANGDERRSGDTVYSQVVTVQPVASKPIAEPQGPPMILSEGGVVLADGLGMTERLAPLALATVRGSDLTAGGTRQTASFSLGGDFPTVLAGTCVLVNGIDAPLKSATPDRIDFQVPAVPSPGTVSVQVVRDCRLPTRTASEAATVPVVPAQPAFMVFRAGPGAVAALHASDGTPVGPKNLLPGIESSPAASGEIVSLFATGLGQVVPPLEAGAIAHEPRPLAALNYRVSIGESAVPPVNVHYVGAAPGFLGTYRLDVEIPNDTLDGLYPVSIEMDGVASLDGPSLIVGNLFYDTGAIPCERGGPVPLNQPCFMTFRGVIIRFRLDRESDRMCAFAPARNLKVCGSSSVQLPGYPYVVAKDNAGVWTLLANTATAATPAGRPEPEP